MASEVSIKGSQAPQDPLYVGRRTGGQKGTENMGPSCEEDPQRY